MTAEVWFALVAGFVSGQMIGILITQRLLGPKQQAARKADEDPREIVVKRTVPSFRHPSRTTEDRYERYRTNSGLYAPVRPGKGSTADEVDKD